MIVVDIEFENVAELLGNFEFNIAAAIEQMVKVERIIITVKDLDRGIVNTCHTHDYNFRIKYTLY